MGQFRGWYGGLGRIKKFLLLLVAVTFVALILLEVILPGAEEERASYNVSEINTEQVNSSHPEPIGGTARSGDFAFTVTGVEQAQTIGQGVMATEAQGKYVIVNLRVKNIGTQVATFNATSQLTYGALGNEYSTSADAIMSGNQADQFLFVQQISPGSAVAGRLVYEVPEQVQLTKVALEGKLFALLQRCHCL